MKAIPSQIPILSLCIFNARHLILLLIMAVFFPASHQNALAGVALFASAENGQRAVLTLSGPYNSSLSTQSGKATAGIYNPNMQQANNCSSGKGDGVTADTLIASMPLGNTIPTARVCWTNYLANGTGGLVLDLTPPPQRRSGAAVDVTVFSGRTNYAGFGKAEFDDPLVLTNAASQTIQFAFELASGAFSLSLSNFNQTSDSGSAEIDTVAGSDIPGLTNFFSWSVSLNTTNHDQLTVTFVSNPALGLDDAAIQSQIASHLAYDPVNQQYIVNADYDYVVFGVTVPSDQETANFTWDSTANATYTPASSVPTLSRPVSIILGLLLLAGGAAVLGLSPYRQRAGR